MRTTIREVVLLILVVGVVIGWCVDHQANASRALRIYVAMSTELSKRGMASRLVGDKIEFSEDGVDWKAVNLSNPAVMEPLEPFDRAPKNAD